MTTEKEQEYREALEIWLKDHPGKTINDISVNETVLLPSKKIINLGKRIYAIKNILKGTAKSGVINEDQYQYWINKQGLQLENKIQKRQINSEKKLKEGLEIWLQKNPGKTINEIPISDEILLSSGKKFRIGIKVMNLKKKLKLGKLTKEEKQYLVIEKGLSNENQKEKQKKQKEQEYREALEIWLKEHPGKTINDIPQRETVQLLSGKIINLGFKIAYIRAILRGTTDGKLTDEQYTYWIIEKGLTKENRGKKRNIERDQEYQKALEIWLKEHPRKTINDILKAESVILPSGTFVNLGSKVSSLRQKDEKKLTPAQREYWIEKHGLTIGNKVDQMCYLAEKKYREALEYWLQKHPGKTVNDVSYNTIVLLPSGENVFLGNKIANIKSILKGTMRGKIRPFQREYWIEKQGLTIKNKKAREEDECREALELWLQKHPGKTINDISQKEVVYLPSGKEITLGVKIFNLRDIIRGTISKEITEEQYAYWFEKQGLSFIQTSEQRKSDFYNENQIQKISSLLKPKQITVEEVLKIFHISLETLNLSCEPAKRIPQPNIQKKEGETLQRYCVRNGYDYEIVKRALNFQTFYPEETLKQLMNRSISYQEESKKNIPDWIKQTYGPIKDHLQKLSLNDAHILKAMKDNVIPIEQAIKQEIFWSNLSSSKDAWLETLYNKLIEDFWKQVNQKEKSEQFFYSFIKKYELNQKEYIQLWRLFLIYITTIKQYQNISKDIPKGYQLRKRNKEENTMEQDFILKINQLIKEDVLSFCLEPKEIFLLNMVLKKERYSRMAKMYYEHHFSDKILHQSQLQTLIEKTKEKIEKLLAWYGIEGLKNLKKYQVDKIEKQTALDSALKNNFSFDGLLQFNLEKKKNPNFCANPYADQIPVQSLDISITTIHAFQKAKIKTVQDLFDYLENCDRQGDPLLSFRGVGITRIEQLKKELADMGISFKEKINFEQSYDYTIEYQQIQNQELGKGKLGQDFILKINELIKEDVLSFCLEPKEILLLSLLLKNEHYSRIAKIYYEHHFSNKILHYSELRFVIGKTKEKIEKLFAWYGIEGLKNLKKYQVDKIDKQTALDSAIQNNFIFDGILRFHLEKKKNPNFCANPYAYQIPVQSLDISITTIHAFLRAKIKTVQDLFDYLENCDRQGDPLLSFRGVGVTRVEQLKKELADMGISFKEKENEKRNFEQYRDYLIEYQQLKKREKKLKKQMKEYLTSYKK